MEMNGLSVLFVVICARVWDAVQFSLVVFRFRHVIEMVPGILKIIMCTSVLNGSCPELPDHQECRRSWIPTTTV